MKGRVISPTYRAYYSIIRAYRSIITRVKKINPDVIILLAQIIPIRKLPKYSYIPERNTEIFRMVAA